MRLVLGMKEFMKNIQFYVKIFYENRVKRQAVPVFSNSDGKRARGVGQEKTQLVH